MNLSGFAPFFQLAVPLTSQTFVRPSPIQTRLAALPVTTRFTWFGVAVLSATDCRGEPKLVKRLDASPVSVPA